MNSEKIIEKIKKLLELTTSPNKNEAEHAMNTAQKLMLKYSINYTEVAEQCKIQPEIIEVEYTNDLTKRTGVSEQVPFIIGLICPIFGVHGLIRQNPITRMKQFFLFGFPANIEIAKFALDSLLNQGNADARAKYREYRTTTFGLSFWTGFKEGLFEKFKGANQQSYGLIVYDAVKNKVNSLATGTHISENFDGVAYGEGMESGKNAELRKALKFENEGKLIS